MPAFWRVCAKALFSAALINYAAKLGALQV
jgi:hypothetical protein